MLPVWKSIDGPVAVASISASDSEPLTVTCEVPITQEEGTPSHSNPRLLTGYYKCNVLVSPTGNENDATVYPIQFWPTPPESPSGYIDEDDYVYGAQFEINRNGIGTLIQYYKLFIFGGNFNFYYLDAVNGIFYTAGSLTFRKTLKDISDDEVPDIRCTRFAPCAYSEILQHDDSITYYTVNGQKRLVIHCSAYANNVSGFRNFISNNGVRALFERKTPYKTTFDATKIMPVEGQNYIWSDIGDTIRVSAYSYDIDEHVNLIKKGNQQHIRVTFLFDNMTFEDEDFVMDMANVSGYMNPDIDISFGTAYAQEVSLNFLRSSKTDDLNWAREFELSFGVDDDNGETLWTTVGIFAGTRPVSTMNDSIRFNAYDRMQRFDKPAGDFLRLLTYPCTLRDIYNKLCSFVGLSNEAGDELEYVMSRTFDSAFDTDSISSLRDLLSKIAQANGCYAKITRYGKVRLVWFADHRASYELTRDDIFSIETTDLSQTSGMQWDHLFTWEEMANLKWNELYEKSSPLLMQGVSASWNNDEITVIQPPDASAGAKRIWNDIADRTWYEAREYTWNDISDLGWRGNYVYMADNPFVFYENENDIRLHLQQIVNRIRNFPAYQVARINAVGNWFVEPGDVIELEQEDGTIVNYPVFSRAISWNGACECDYESTGSLAQ